MRQRKRNLVAFVMAWLLSQNAASLGTQQAPQTPTTPGRIRVTTELVLVNVVARDKKGNLVRDLKKEDFTLLEDGKKQEISTFDFENVDQPLTAGAAEGTVTGTAGGARSTVSRIAASSSATRIFPAGIKFPLVTATRFPARRPRRHKPA